MFWNISPYFHVRVQNSLDVGAQFQDARPTLPCDCCTPQGSHRVATTCEERTLQIDRSITQDLSTNNIKMWAFKKIFGKCWHLPNVDLAWHPIGPVFNVESCRLGDSRRQRFLLPITAMKKGGKGWPNDEDRLWGNPGGEVIETCSPDSWLKFSVSVSIDEYFTHSWLEEEFWPGIIMVMLKERCFVIFKVEFFKYVQMTWQAVSRPRDFLVLQGCCPTDAQESALFCYYRDEAEIAVELYLPCTAVDVKRGSSRDGVAVETCWNLKHVLSYGALHALYHWVMS